jgi:hypothetical protein
MESLNSIDHLIEVLMNENRIPENAVKDLCEKVRVRVCKSIIGNRNSE